MDDHDHEHYHHHHNLKEPLPLAYIPNPRIASVVQKRADTRPYIPREGEILVKDSYLYNIHEDSPRPVKISMRRNYWPLIDNTVTALASKAAAGANAVKNLLKVKFYNHYDHVNEAVQHKKQKIKSILLSAAHNVHNHPLIGKHTFAGQHPFIGQNPLINKQPLIQHIKPPVIIYSKTKPLPTTTISEDYIHTYDNNYVVPKYVTKGGLGERNPYASMGVTSYKHFEDTILKELEEKEERKVEATLHTLFDDKYLLEETLLGTKPVQSDEWTPLNSGHPNIIGVSQKPYSVSNLGQQFNDVRPVCEHLDEIGVSPTLFVYPEGIENQLEQQQASSNENGIIAKPSEPSPAVRTRYSISKPIPIPFQPSKIVLTTTERPNYPEYFLKQQQQIKKLLGSTRNNLRGNKVLQRQKFGQQIHATAPTTSSPSALLFYPINGTDDGFRPMAASDINMMQIKKPIRIKINVTSSTLPKKSKSITTNVIQAESSNIQTSIISPPKKNTIISKASETKTMSPPATTTTSPTPPSRTSTRIVNTNEKNSYKAVQKNNRGSIKFSDSISQSR